MAFFFFFFMVFLLFFLCIVDLALLQENKICLCQGFAYQVVTCDR